MSKQKSGPKIVIFDFESLPDPRRVYRILPSIGAWPGRSFKAELHSIITFGYKIYGDKGAKTVSSWDFPESWEKDPQDDSAVVQFAYEMLKDADEIVTHNGKSFDVKLLNTRLAFYGMPPLPKIPHVDTKFAAKGLSLYSNSLDNVAKFFGVHEKMHFGNKWGLWERMAFQEETKKDRDLMDEYCVNDVLALEAIYEKLRPHHSTNSVNKNFFSNERVCPTCGSNKLHKHGTKRTRTKEYDRLLCQDCGSVSQQSKKGVVT